MSENKKSEYLSLSSQNISFSWNNHQQIENDNFVKMKILNGMKNTNKHETKVNERDGNPDDNKHEIDALRKNRALLQQRLKTLQNRLKPLANNAQSHASYSSSNEHPFGAENIYSNHEQSQQNQHQAANQENEWNRRPLIKRRRIMRHNYEEEGKPPRDMNEEYNQGQNERNKEMTRMNGIGDGNHRSHYQNRNNCNNNGNNHANRNNQGFSGHGHNPYQYNNNLGSNCDNNGYAAGSGHDGLVYDTIKGGYNHSGYRNSRQRNGGRGFKNGYSSQYRSYTGYPGSGFRGYEHGKLANLNDKQNFDGVNGKMKNLAVNYNNNKTKPMTSYSNNKNGNHTKSNRKSKNMGQRKLKEIFKEPSIKMILSRITRVVIAVFYDGCMKSHQFHQILSKIDIENPSTGFFAVEWEFIPSWRNQYALEYDSLPITLFFVNGKIVNGKEGYEWASNFRGDLDENVVKEVLIRNKMIDKKPESFYCKIDHLR